MRIDTRQRRHRGGTGGGNRSRACLLAACAALLTAGCVRHPAAALKLEQPSPPPSDKLDLASYLRAARLGEWVYERSEVPAQAGAEPARYVRRVTADRLSEGLLHSLALLPLDRYMEVARSAGAGSEPGRAPRLPVARRESPHLFELDQPLSPFPPELETAGSAESVTPLRYYGRSGRLENTGTLTRRVRVEGLQDVDCPAGHFSACLRLRLDLNVQFPLWISIDLSTYVWLSKAAGEVRRVEEVSGWVLIFWFGSAHEYRLVSYTHQPPETQPAAGGPSIWPLWRRGLMTLDRGAPEPRISGMVVDLSEPPSSQPAP